MLRSLTPHNFKQRNFFQSTPPVRKLCYPSHLLNVPPKQVTTLPSGLRVVTENNFGALTTVGVWVGSGSLHENSSNNGTAHFLEHMAFKGTPKWNKHQLELCIENMGANLNAYTSREGTAYLAQSFKKDTGFMMGVIADILQNSELRKDNIESERSTILKEKEVVESNDEELLFDYLHAIAFQGHPLSLTILGETQNIKSINRRHLVDYINTHYVAPRMTIVAVGGVVHENIVSEAEKLFRYLPTEDTVPPPPEVHVVGSEIRVLDNSKPVANIIFGFEAVSAQSPYIIPLQILQCILGTWDRNMGAGKHMSSPLTPLISSGLAHSFRTLPTYYNCGGIFNLQFMAPPEHLEELTVNTFKELKSFTSRLTEEDLQRVKNKLLCYHLIHMDTSLSIAEELSRQIISLGRVMPAVELFSRINAVQLSDIADCVDLLFSDTDPVIVAKGPIENLPSYDTIWQIVNNK